jgi:ligand-binding sensor domain-containing protein/two-component sensor histidine kinase
MRYLLSRIISLLLLPIGLIVLFATVTCGQEYSYARYDVKDGLAGSVVYCATEDKDGFLWFGTETGLSRFDGTHFKNFTTADGLPDNEITQLFVDSKNRVWMRPFKNSLCYYYKGKIYNNQNDSLLSRLKITSYISDIAEDNDGYMVIVEAFVIHFIAPDNKITTISRIKGNEFQNNLAGMRANRSLGVLVVLKKGNQKLMCNFNKGVLSSLDALPDAYTPKIFISHISPKLEIFCMGDSLDIIQNSVKRKPVLLPPECTGVSVIDDSTFVINTTDGSLFYDVNKGLIFRHCLPGKAINAVIRDHEYNYWFVSRRDGIYRIGSFDFNNIRITDNYIDFYSIFSLNKIGSYMYIGAEKSLLYKVDLRHQPFTIEKRRLHKKTIDARITSITEFPRHHVTVGTDMGVITISPSGNKRILKATLPVKSLNIYKDKLLLSFHTGTSLIGTDLKLPVGNSYEGRSTCSYALQDTFYVGTLEGLYQIIPSGATTFMGARFSLFKSRISDIKASKDGILWVATNGNGLVGYKNGQVVYTIRKQDGLTSDICRTIYVTGRDVWVGTEKGLNRVQLIKNGYTVTVFTRADGLLSDIINAVYAQGDEVYAGTSEGLTYFDASKISLHSYCKLHITGIQTSHTKWTYDTSGFVLPHADNDVRIEYVGISYRSAGDITYRYSLKGLNDNWQTTRETFVSYPSLPSGDYELQLKAINKFGGGSEIIRLPFSIEKLLWEKNWFRVLALLIIGGIAWFFVSLRIKKIRRQNDEKTQMNDRMAELEQMALKAQMNPHFIFNSLNSVQHYVIEKDILGANKFITEFSRLIRMTLDISSKTSISLYEEISYLTTYLELEKTKFENKFSYEIDLDSDLDPSEWYIPPMILQPYVENSIRHGVRNRTDNKGHIRIAISGDQTYLVFSIEDNGVGREAAARYKSQLSIEYQSKGMTLTAKRIEMLNKGQQVPVLIDVEDLYQDNMPAGTRVIVKFPLVDADRNY